MSLENLQSVKFLTTPQILAINDRINKRCGGTGAVRDLSLIESAVGRPQATFDEKYLYPTLFGKAAALFTSLLKNHPFVDGNKRTALASCGIFLKINGIKLKNYHAEEVEFVVAEAGEHDSIEAVSAWFMDHSVKD